MKTLCFPFFFLSFFLFSFGLKQHTFILLKFWRSESKKCLIGAYSRCRLGWFLLKVQGENPFLAFSVLQGPFSVLGLWPHITCLSPSASDITTLSPSFVVRSLSASSSYQDTWDRISGPPLVSLNDLPISRSLIISAKSTLPWKVTFMRSRDWDMGQRYLTDWFLKINK